MVNKLRGLSVVASLFLLAVSVWIAVRYDVPSVLATSVASAALIVGLPVALAYGKLGGRRAWRSLRDQRRDGIPDRQRTLVSETPVENPTAVLTAVADAVRDTEEFDDVRREEFDDGNDGLMVTHAGFHSSFVRITDEDHVAITGGSKRTRALGRLIERVRPLSMAAQPNNPFHDPIPVRGAPRVFLGVFMIVVVILATGSMVGTAYPGEPYTAGEKAVLVGMDARADFDGGVTPTEARLDKAQFIVDAVGEEAVEVNWTSDNQSARVTKHGRQALAMSADARALLATVRASDPTPEQAARADRIEADLRAAEERVAAEITRRIENGEIERTEALAATLADLRAPPAERG